MAFFLFLQAVYDTIMTCLHSLCLNICASDNYVIATTTLPAQKGALVMLTTNRLNINNDPIYEQCLDWKSNGSNQDKKVVCTNLPLTISLYFTTKGKTDPVILFKKESSM